MLLHYLYGPAMKCFHGGPHFLMSSQSFVYPNICARNFFLCPWSLVWLIIFSFRLCKQPGVCHLAPLSSTRWAFVSVMLSPMSSLKTWVLTFTRPIHLHFVEDQVKTYIMAVASSSSINWSELFWWKGDLHYLRQVFEGTTDHVYFIVFLLFYMYLLRQNWS